MDFVVDRQEKGIGRNPKMPFPVVSVFTKHPKQGAFTLSYFNVLYFNFKKKEFYIVTIRALGIIPEYKHIELKTTP